MDKLGWIATNPRVKIEWLYDEYYFENCGWNTATGVRITANDKVIFESEPVAFYDISWTPEEIFHEFLESLGATVESDNVYLNEEGSEDE